MVHKQTIHVYYLNTFQGANIYVFVQSHETHLNKIWSLNVREILQSHLSIRSKNTLNVKC